MATAQVVSATTALHDEKIEEQPIKKPQEDIKNTEDQETATEPQSQEEPADNSIIAPEPEPEAKPEAEPEAEPKPEPEIEPKDLAVGVETKAVIKEELEEAKLVSPVDQPAKVAPEPCVEEEAKETKGGTPVEPETEPAKPEPEPEEKNEKKEEVVVAE